MISLRQYQKDAADAVFREWRTVDSTLVVKPTGCGKTLLFASIIADCFPGRAMVIAHREELITQAVDKIRRVTGFAAAVEMADQKADLNNMFGMPQVVVSTVQTQTAGGDGGGRMSKFLPSDFALLVIDEAHHATSPSYRRVIDYYRQNPALKVLGVTATPDRADEEDLGQVFESVAYDYEILDAIHDGWLVPIEQQMVSVEGLDFSGVRTTAGDLNGADLATVMEYEKNLHAVADPAVKIAGTRRAIVFSASVAHAERLSEILNRHRDGSAAWICGETDKDERRRILRDFAEGRIQFVCNCGVLTEGFDDPGVELIIMARPTKSRALYAQMAGRGTRPLPGVVDGPPTADERKAAIAASGKTSCLIVDFVGNSGRHKLMSTADILDGNYSDEAVESAVAKAREGGRPVRMDELIDEEEARIKAEKEARRLAEAANRARLKIGATFKTSKVNPFDAFGIQPPKERGWDKGRQLSEKQRSLLSKQGIDPDSMSYAEGRRLISELFSRWDGDMCSYKQASVLARAGLPTGVSREAASKLIDVLAKNRWRKCDAVDAVLREVSNAA
jgi:superfamily II DNA or RNA helicase